jgi:hypothetical protein
MMVMPAPAMTSSGALMALSLAPRSGNSVHTDAAVKAPPRPIPQTPLPMLDEDDTADTPTEEVASTNKSSAWMTTDWGGSSSRSSNGAGGGEREQRRRASSAVMG